MTKEPIEVLNIRIPKEVVNWMDLIVERGIYKSRAEAIREFCREHLRDNGDDPIE